jgi:chromosome segregation ATPase
MPHSTRTLPQLPKPIPNSQPPLTRQTSNNLVVGNGLIRKLSAEFGPIRIIPNNINTSPNDSNSNSNSVHVVEQDSSGNTSAGPGGPTQWSSAVGRANLGKSGRVIERLMGENDMLKRDLNLERLRAEESRQAVKMAEGKMEALAAEYDGKLHDAAINKTLLKRRERQLSDLKAQIEGERQRADMAVERERTWREELERVQEDCNKRVEEAQTYAALMKGRNDALTSHWKEQGAEVDRTVAELSKEIESIVEERRNDDRKMNMLQGLCDQQAELLGSLEREKQGIQKAFESYKWEQDESLRGLKERARLQEAANEAALLETQRVLGELKWALAVKKNVKGAQ